MAIHCTLCGANLALIGRAHRCIPRVDAQPVANAIDAGANVANAPPVSAGASVTYCYTYRYRDADKRRTYMRELMCKRRAAARAS
jgi:hypothetical protein